MYVLIVSRNGVQTFLILICLVDLNVWERCSPLELSSPERANQVHLGGSGRQLTFSKPSLGLLGL